MRDQRNARRRPQIPPDDPFLEALFSAICKNLFVLPGETFVDEARRWTEALNFTAALRPRSQQEWLQAADVTIEQFSAIHSLVLRKRRDISTRQRAKHEQAFLEHAKAMQDARLRYDLLRQSRTP